MIALSQIKLRPALEKAGDLPVRMWAYPVLSWITVILLVGLTILMLWDPSARVQVITVAVAFVGLSILGFVVGKTNPRAREHEESTI